MRGTSRIAASLATLIALTVGAAACSENNEGHQAATSTLPGSTSTQPSPSPTSSGPSPAETRIEVSIANGQVTPSPDRRVEVSQGDQVRIVVTSDRADEIHVHGYDVEAAVEPGSPATLEFEADQPGSFEVEMHELDPGLLFTLLVR